MPISKRWPILVAVGSAIGFVGNNYRIAGLEQLRLERKSSATTNTSSANMENGVWSDTFPRPVNSSHPLPSVYGASKGSGDELFEKLPPWEPQLSVGEKLAVMQDHLSQKIGELAGPTIDSAGLPLAAPLTLPPGLERNRPAGMLSGGLPSVGSNPQKSAPGHLSGTNALDGQVPSIRVASYCVQGLGATQLSKPNVAEALVAIIRQFELVALQGVQSDRDDILPLLIERLNQSGRRYDYLIGPRVGHDSLRQQFAFLFDMQRIETDRYQLYTVDDPENLISNEPLVAWFRCKEMPASQSFTFSLVNARIPPERAQAEQLLLRNLIHAVVNDGRQEDDVILVGDFAGNSASISNLNIESVRHAIRDVPTDVSGERMLSGIVLPAQATCEYTGRSGVFDFLRKYNLSLERALEVSQQMPVWAEFYTVEGAQPGRVAPTGKEDVL